MTSSTVARTRAELLAKSDAFDEELEHWMAATKELPAHTSQIGRLCAVLAPLSKRVRAGIEAMDDAAIEADGHRPASEVLLLFRIWAFYRDKLAQRYVPWHRPHLAIADKLAHRWWKPALDAALACETQSAKKARLAKSPPLVYFNGDVSPFTLTRGSPFQAEAAEGLAPEYVSWASRVLRESPVPVIAIPYFSGRHSPDLLVMAHEVGHNVEDDFGLSECLAAALEEHLVGAAVPPDRRKAWAAWTGEIFADVWGVLSAGPAFVDALLAFGITSQADVAAEKRPGAMGWGEYPTVMLRAELLFAALRSLGLADEARSRKTAFRERFPKHAMEAYEPDCALVIGALLDCVPKAFGKPVRSLVRDVATVHGEATSLAAKLVKNRKSEERDTLVLVLALAYAFADAPAEIATRARSASLTAALRATVESEIRAGDGGAPAAEIARADARWSDDLFASLLAARATS